MAKPTRTKGELPLTSLLPNLVTVAAICAGLTAIRFAFQGSFEAAVTLILVAGVLDGLDGRLARMLKSESALGAELDSLADFLNFGIAPALILYVWAFQDMRNLGWIAIVIYALCCVLRLARFNIGNKSEVSEGPKKFFVGVPAPAGAMLVMLPMFLSFIWARTPILPAGLIGVYMIGVGLLMV
ncbi:MAG TPA: CDP-diacylglycerol--serine O-phosphatidyltransferase, partial [Paracoccaceae bacterium]|nr:CDP-diacylglycerol--serine O-phosphatidyltransferase [Paracoccaceae bacterium]